MTIFGLHLELLTALQILATVIIVGLYAFYSFMQEQEADYESDCEMLMLCSAVLSQSDVDAGLQKLTDATSAHLSNSENTIFHFVSRLRAFEKTGSLPDKKLAARAQLGLTLFVVAFAPFFTWALFLFLFGEERKYRLHRIEHTSIRRNRMSANISLTAMSVVYLVLGAELIGSGWRLFGITVSTIASIGFVGSLCGLFVPVLFQLRWKKFWRETLMGVMGLSSVAKDHDLFNRAQLLKNNVDAQPDVPLPGGIGVYTAVYSAVQALLYWMFKITAT